MVYGAKKNAPKRGVGPRILSLGMFLMLLSILYSAKLVLSIKLFGEFLKCSKKSELLYGQVESKIKKASEVTTDLKIAPEDGCRLVEIANTVALGDMKTEIHRLLENVKTLSSTVDPDRSYFTNISFQADNILKTVSGWDKTISKYI